MNNNTSSPFSSSPVTTASTTISNNGDENNVPNSPTNINPTPSNRSHNVGNNVNNNTLRLKRSASMRKSLLVPLISPGRSSSFTHRYNDTNANNNNNINNINNINNNNNSNNKTSPSRNSKKIRNSVSMSNLHGIANAHNNSTATNIYSTPKYHHSTSTTTNNNFNDSVASNNVPHNVNGNEISPTLYKSGNIHNNSTPTVNSTFINKNKSRSRSSSLIITTTSPPQKHIQMHNTFAHNSNATNIQRIPSNKRHLNNKVVGGNVAQASNPAVPYYSNNSSSIPAEDSHAADNTTSADNSNCIDDANETTTQIFTLLANKELEILEIKKKIEDLKRTLHLQEIQLNKGYRDLEILKRKASVELFKQHGSTTTNNNNNTANTSTVSIDPNTSVDSQNTMSTAPSINIQKNKHNIKGANGKISRTLNGANKLDFHSSGNGASNVSGNTSFPSRKFSSTSSIEEEDDGNKLYNDNNNNNSNNTGRSRMSLYFNKGINLINQFDQMLQNELEKKIAWEDSISQEDVTPQPNEEKQQEHVNNQNSGTNTDSPSIWSNFLNDMKAGLITTLDGNANDSIISDNNNKSDNCVDDGIELIDLHNDISISSINSTSSQPAINPGTVSDNANNNSSRILTTATNTSKNKIKRSNTINPTTSTSTKKDGGSYKYFSDI